MSNSSSCMGVVILAITFLGFRGLSNPLEPSLFASVNCSPSGNLINLLNQLPGFHMYSTIYITSCTNDSREYSTLKQKITTRNSATCCRLL